MTLQELLNKIENTKPEDILESLKNSYVPISKHEKCKLIGVEANKSGKDIFHFERELNDKEKQHFGNWVRNYVSSEMKKGLK